MKKNEKEEELKKERAPLEQVLGTVLQMQQYMHNATNMEAAKILHDTGWCTAFIDDCPLCAQESGEEE